jgi:hypothetical protein
MHQLNGNLLVWVLII